MAPGMGHIAPCLLCLPRNEPGHLGMSCTGRGECLRGPASRSPGLGDLQPVLHPPPALQKEAQEPGCTLQRCWILPLAAGGAFQ